jgi:hypothetical protein
VYKKIRDAEGAEETWRIAEFFFEIFSVSFWFWLRQVVGSGFRILE